MIFRVAFTYILFFATTLALAGGIVTTVKLDDKTITIYDTTDTAKLESFVKRMVSGIDNEGKKLSFGEVKSIAQEYGLHKIGGVNFAMKIQDGDIGYWQDQELTRTEYEIQFLSRRIVLDSANEERITVGDEGKLSFAAERLIQHTVNKIAQ